MIFKAIIKNSLFLLIVSSVLLFFTIYSLVQLDPMQVEEYKLPLYHLGGLFRGSFIYLLLLGLVAHILIVVVICVIASELKLVENGTSLIPLVYLLFLSIIEPNLLFTPGLFALLMIILVIRILLYFQVRNNIHAPILYSSSILGFTALVYPPSVVFVLPSLLGLLIFRPFKIRELVIFLLGLLLPFYYFFGITYISDGLMHIPSLADLKFQLERSIELSAIDQIALLLFTLLSLLSFMYIFSNSFTMVVRNRNFCTLWGLFFLSTLFLFSFSGIALHDVLLFGTPFMVLVLTYYLSKLRRSWYVETALILIVVFSFISDLLI